jgi:hypothetical protein
MRITTLLATFAQALTEHPESVDELIDGIIAKANLHAGRTVVMRTAKPTEVFTADELTELEERRGGEWLTAAAAFAILRGVACTVHGTAINAGRQLRARYPKTKTIGPTRYYFIEPRDSSPLLDSAEAAADTTK